MRKPPPLPPPDADVVVVDPAVVEAAAAGGAAALGADVLGAAADGAGGAATASATGRAGMVTLPAGASCRGRAWNISGVPGAKPCTLPARTGMSCGCATTCDAGATGAGAA